MTTTAEHIAAIREALAEPEIARFPDFTKAVSAMADELDRLKAENERMREALEPFADIAGESWADKDGWTDAACQKDRIVDWFGPSAFHNARAVLKGDTHGN